MSNLLNNHPMVFWDGEIYEKLIKDLNIKDIKSDFKSKIKKFNDIKFISDLSKDAGHKYYGFEVKFFHMHVFGAEIETYVDNLANNGIENLIVLKRENYLKKVVSSIISHKTKMFSIFLKMIKTSINTIHVDINNVGIDLEHKPLLEFLNSYDESFGRLENALSNHNCLWLTYEEHVQANPMIGYKAICEYLGLEYLKSEIKLSRTNPYSLQDMITNYDEVANLLNNTKYEWMLYQ